MTHVGKPAPDFNLDGVFKSEVKKYSLGGFTAKWLVLFFYPKDFTYICPTEIKAFSHRNAEFEEMNVYVLGVSVDSIDSHKKWIESGELGDVNFPLISDESKTMTNDYGVMKEDEQLAFRGTFIIAPDGVVRYMLVSDNDVGRSVTETLRVIKALQMGKLCPVEWQPGEKTLN